MPFGAMPPEVMAQETAIVLDAKEDRRALLYSILYGGLAVGALIGIVVSTYFWRRHAQTLDKTPSERAETLMESCESKLEEIERALAELQSSRS